ncbi:unnamed protein product [Lasius platythorax]|uniref:Uncharacterized protein n=1 Tax=Lasius platythorax TaxID=488582 RepID=A0AAV2P060_9HYME
MFIHNRCRDETRRDETRRDEETLKSHFNEKGKSRITALPLPDDGAVPAGTGRPLISERFVMRYPRERGRLAVIREYVAVAVDPIQPDAR